MPIGTTAAARLLNKDFNGTDYTPIGSYWVGFRSDGVELTDADSPGYVRIEIEVGLVNFPDTATTMIQNGVSFSTPQATGDWLQADEVVLYDAETVGEYQYGGLLDQPFTMLTGRTRTFGVGALRIRFI